MTVIFGPQNVNIASGEQIRGPFSLSNVIKKNGVPVQIRVSMEAENFPNGTTTIELQFSIDGGSTFPFAASGTYVMPAEFKGAAPHFWELAYNLDQDAVPTHARTRTISPSAFTTSVTIDSN